MDKKSNGKLFIKHVQNPFINKNITLDDLVENGDLGESALDKLYLEDALDDEKEKKFRLEAAKRYLMETDEDSISSNSNFKPINYWICYLFSIQQKGTSLLEQLTKLEGKLRSHDELIRLQELFEKKLNSLLDIRQKVLAYTESIWRNSKRNIPCYIDAESELKRMRDILLVQLRGYLGDSKPFNSYINGFEIIDRRILRALQDGKMTTSSEFKELMAAYIDYENAMQKFLLVSSAIDTYQFLAKEIYYGNDLIFNRDAVKQTALPIDFLSYDELENLIMLTKNYHKSLRLRAKMNARGLADIEIRLNEMRALEELLEVVEMRMNYSSKSYISNESNINTSVNSTNKQYILPQEVIFHADELKIMEHAAKISGLEGNPDYKNILNDVKSRFPDSIDKQKNAKTRSK